MGGQIQVLVFALMVSIPPAMAADHSEPPKPSLIDCAKVMKTLFQERDELQHSLTSVKEGHITPAQFTVTPSDREVSFFVKENGGSSRYDGRIKSMTTGADGEPQIVFSRKDYNDQYKVKDEVIPLSKIDPNSAAVKKVLSEKDLGHTVAIFTASIENGEYVSFVSQFGGPRQEQGRIRELTKDKEGKITGFVLAEDNGMEVSNAISSIDPASIKTFKVQPRALSATETSLVQQLDSAITEKRYVSFQIKDLSGGRVSHFEGWVTQADFTTDGEYLFRINEYTHDPSKRSGRIVDKIKLSNIIIDSFNPSPKLEVSAHPLSGANVDAFIESRYDGTQKTSIPEILYRKLSAFADAEKASGPDLPEELQRAVSPGSELRLYFQSGERRIRLTIRREVNGSWRFGDTAFDRLAVGEAYQDDYSKSRYTINEKDRLEEDRFNGRLPAAALREHLSMIRSRLMHEGIMNEFGPIYEQWEKAIPENISDGNIGSLLLYSQGQTYHLDGGFVRQNLPRLTEPDAKKLAAIQYLVNNNSVFWSYNAGASGISEGIYQQGAVKPQRMWLAGYDFGSSLFKAMENAGLKFVNGEWVKN